MLRILIILFTLLNISSAGFNCRNPNHCQVFCNNYKNFQINLLKNTEWITVPWDNGDCYFHNQKTGENIEKFPINFLRKSLD